MGLMKRFLMEKISELASKIGASEELIYKNDRLYDLAVRYAQLELLNKVGKKEV